MGGFYQWDVKSLSMFVSCRICEQDGEKSDTGVAASVPAAAAVINNIPHVTAHVLDTVSGRPAVGVAVKLFSKNQSGTWSHVADRYGTLYRSCYGNDSLHCWQLCII